ncbi:MAG: type II CRISPR RNA-guided endonuclease Cas9 [Erysipelotrichaceae bacterium]|nr:type II CRISPR RNA-guided endonuclease Cas9 [Erysipelotrichaceae bacterium]
MERKAEDYYLGLDIGTDSIGYAVTDEAYQVLKFNCKSIWGVRLFEEGQTSKERRTFRTVRKNIQRRTWRLSLLQELFSTEIAKVDPGFFIRMKESMLLSEDKTECQPYTLFNNKDYNDRNFYHEYPTIYHLRKELLINPEAHDIRLVYLALHHLIKHRGHFLFPGSVDSVTDFRNTFDNFKQVLSDELNLEIECRSETELIDILKDKKISKRDKNHKIMELFACDQDDKQLKAVIGLICGSKVKLADVFADPELNEAEVSAIAFSDLGYEDKQDQLEEVLEERASTIDAIKTLYDWGLLADILSGGSYNGASYLSIAKVKTYEKHKHDLTILKKLIKKYARVSYSDFFQKVDDKIVNYCSYIGYTKCNGKKLSVKRCKKENLYKEINKLIKDLKVDNNDQDALAYISTEINNDTFLPLLVSKDNSVIPYQINEMELKKILDNAGVYLPFLNSQDASNISVADKIVDIFEFRIPYYVGPLNTINNEHAWMERQPGATGKIYPWNFTDKVDIDASAKRFITRMTNKCTYLIGRDVLPKHSLLYEEYLVLNELNNLRINTEKVSVQMKKQIVEDLYKVKKKVTRKTLLNYLRNHLGLDIDDTNISGIDVELKESLSSYNDFHDIFGTAVENNSTQKMIENIILWKTLYGDDQKMLKRIIMKSYDKNIINTDQLTKIVRSRYQGWGRLSRELLDGIQGFVHETGEVMTIIQALRTTNDNFMQLLSQKYTFGEAINMENQTELGTFNKLTYEEVFKDTSISPSLKRSMWQVILIAREIVKIMGHQPKKIFVEMARGSEEKKRTTSRKGHLLELYKNIKDESRDWKAELENKTESDFRNIKLYLYYTQQGRCMYCGEAINLSELANTNIYDRDHIYPQSKTKDDSFDNLVLVKKVINSKKSDGLISGDIQAKMQPFWKMLKDKKYISEEKYKRLTRKTTLTDEELAGFINRQLVETRQSTKFVANLLKQIYTESNIVYVKATLVSTFRHETLDNIKVRSVNDYHHAKDAYLNIVVGNVYNEKFTSNPLTWLNKHKTTEDRNYSLNQMYTFDLVKNDKVIWKRGKEGSLKTIQKYMGRNDIRYTMYTTVNKGNLFDQQLVKKTNNPSIPVKKGMDPAKYGGYKKITPAYFALVEADGKKGKRQRSIEAVPLYLLREFEKEQNRFLDYCTKEYGLINPKILISMIKKNSYLVIDGFPMRLRGKTGTNLFFQGAVQLLLEDNDIKQVKKIEKYIERNKARSDKKVLLKLNDYDGITLEENLRLYDQLSKKMIDSIYKNRPSGQYVTLIDGRDEFIKLLLEEQCIVLNEVLKLFSCKPVLADLSAINGSKNAGNMLKNKCITNCNDAKIIYQSVTGLFEKEVDLLKL